LHQKDVSALFTCPPGVISLCGPIGTELKEKVRKEREAKGPKDKQENVAMVCPFLM
jgi:hypothetical protein